MGAVIGWVVLSTLGQPIPPPALQLYPSQAACITTLIGNDTQETSQCVAVQADTEVAPAPKPLPPTPPAHTTMTATTGTAKTGTAKTGTTNTIVPGGGTWHLLTRSSSGTVSLLSGLDQHSCAFARARALGLPATPAEEQVEAKRQQRLNPPCPDDPYNKNSMDTWRRQHWSAEGCVSPGGSFSWTGSSGFSQPGDIRSAECFQ